MMKPLALVIGDLSMVRALGRSDIPVVLASSEPAPVAARSRYCTDVLRIPSVVERPDEAIDAIVAWAGKQPKRPVIFYQGDHDLLAVSRHRERVAACADLVLPHAELVEDLVDKLRFAALAQRVGLPVPPTVALRRHERIERELAAWTAFPCVLKPAVRTHWVGSSLQKQWGGSGKAVRVATREELDRVMPIMRAHETDCVLQAAVDGGEDQILSYHAYVRPHGEIVAEFTGRKVRTRPRQYGFSTCVRVVDEPEVRRVGREVLRKLDFSGVLKMDFKRDLRDGQLYLLEINPRFNLWHHAGMVAGVCIPALVYADCVRPGSAQPPKTIRDDVRWLSVRSDLSALLEYRRAGELSITRWLRELVTADVNEDALWQDPLPFFADLVARAKRALPMSSKR